MPIPPSRQAMAIYRQKQLTPLLKLQLILAKELNLIGGIRPATKD